MSFEFRKCTSKEGFEFSGLYEVFPRIFGDHRGYFFESYSERDFLSIGLTVKFVQDNQSFSTKGILRGLHFQTKHPQGKLVRSLSGKVYDVAVDLRQDSSTFGKYYGVILDSERHNMFYIPPGFAHGFYVLTDTATFAYKCTDFYDPAGEGGLMWDDKTIEIDWKSVAPDIYPILSEKDQEHPMFDSTEKYFDKKGKWIGE